MEKGQANRSSEILAILQARMSSSRLPGKVMKKILGKSLLELQIERILRSREITTLLVATSVNPEDDIIETLCRQLQVPCFRGDLNNVLDRFYQACKLYHADTIVRLTGDCPLTDPDKIDELIRFFQEGHYDYANNCIPPCLPHGLDAEIFSGSALETAWRNATLPSEKEHVTPYMINPANGFRVGRIDYPPTHKQFRWCVDEPEDFQLVKIIYESLYPQTPRFTTSDVIDLMKKHPELAGINAGFARNEGYQKSLKEDQAYLSRNLSDR